MSKNLIRILTMAATIAALIVTNPISARAQEPVAVPGEIVIKVPAGTPIETVQGWVDASGCRIIEPIMYARDFYRLTVKSNSNVLSGESLANIKAVPPSAEVNAAVAKLTAIPGVIGNPNWIKKVSQVNRGASAASVPPARVTRATGAKSVPNDPRYPSQAWHMDLIRMPEAWNIQVGIKPIIISVGDSGIDLAHEDFQTASGSRIVPGVNTIDGGSVQDDNGHGTHTAGTCAAATNNGTGVVGVAGWTRGGVDVKILPIKLANAAGQIATSWSVSGIMYAADHSNVMNMSYGGIGSDATESAAVAEGLLKGCVYVASAGNDSSNLPVSPGDIPGVIKVSSVGPQGELAFYSNTGNIDIAAPGGDDPSFANPALQVISTFPGSTYGPDQGTSMAAPHVTGVVALLLAAGAPQNASQIQAAIQNTAQTPPSGADPTRFGAGIVDAYSALLPYTGPSAELISPASDLTTYFKNLTITLRINRLPASENSNVIVEIQKASVDHSVVRTLIGGTDFTIPLPADPTTNPSVDVTLPTILLPEGKFIIVVKYTGAKPRTQSRFFNVLSRTQASGRSMFSVPFTVAPTSPTVSPESSLLISGFNLTRWNPLAGDYVSTSSGDPLASFRALLPNGAPVVADVTNLGASIAPIGLGYWLDLSAPQTLNVSGATVANPVAIQLSAANSGWNMIGCPFTFPVDWSGVSVIAGGVTYTLNEAVRANVIKSAIVGYVNGDYAIDIAPAGQLLPFNGYWVKAVQDCTLVIPPTPTIAIDPTRATRPSAANLGWRVRMSAIVDGDRDGQNYFGQVNGAKPGDDPYDVAKPPSSGSRSYLRFLRDAGNGRSIPFAYDMQPVNNGHTEWTAGVTSTKTGASVTLTWDGLGTLSRRSRLSLIDTATGTRIPMNARSSYTFKSGEAGSTRMFTIALDQEATAGALAITSLRVANAGGSRAVSGATLHFTLNREADVTGRVVTLTGKTVATLGGTTRAAANSEATLRWDGRNRDGAPVPVGTYLIEVTARTSDGQTAQVKRPLLSVR